MAIIRVGWNSFTMVKLTPQEIGLNESLFQPNDRIEGLCRYAHLIHIPFFPLGELWAIRRGNELYEITPEIQKKINDAGIKIPTPWYAFSGIIATVLILIALIISATNRSNSDKEWDRQNRIRTRQFEAADWEMKAFMLNNPDTTDYYLFSTTTGTSAGRFYTASADSFTYLIRRSINDGEWSSSFPEIMAEDTNLITFSIARKDIPKLRQPSYGEKQHPLPVDGDKSVLYLKQVIVTPGPSPRGDLFDYNLYKKGIKIFLANEGKTGTITRIENISGVFNWNTPSNKITFTDGSLSNSLFGEGKVTSKDSAYSFRIYLKDEQERESHFLLKGTLSHVVVWPER